MKPYFSQEAVSLLTSLLCIDVFHNLKYNLTFLSLRKDWDHHIKMLKK